MDINNRKVKHMASGSFDAYAVLHSWGRGYGTRPPYWVGPLKSK